MEKNRFAETLRRVREYRNLSQSQLATETGLDPSTISRLEAGSRNPTRKLIQTIGAALSIMGEGDTRYRELLESAGFYGTEERTQFACMELYRLNQILPDADTPMQTEARLGLRLIIRAVESTLSRRVPE